MDRLPLGTPERPASLEELECWGHTSQSLKRLSKIYEKENSADTIGGVNNLISATPVGEITAIPEENVTVASIKSAQTDLAKKISNISRNANQEISALDDALERINGLLALRKAQERASTTPPRDIKRRGRSDSPSSGIPLSLALGLQSVAPSQKDPAGQSVHRARNSKPKKETIVKHSVLQPGRRVVFQTPKSADMDGDTWIFAIFTRFTGPDKRGGKYEVKDPEPDHNGLPGMTYTANIKSIIPLPNKALPGSPAYLTPHTIFSVGSIVLALYPDTSCFYRATIVALPTSSTSIERIPTYILKVEGEEDEDLTHSVSIYWVIKFPSHLL